MGGLSDRYKTVGRRDFGSALEHMLETEFKLVGSHRVIRLIVERIVELHREFFPETEHQQPGTILWATTKAGEGAKVSWGKRAEAYGTQMVQLPLVTKAEIESRMKKGKGGDAKTKRKKEFDRDMGTAARLLKSAAEQGGLLSGAELSVLMNRSLAKIHEYVRTYEGEMEEALPLKGYVLDMGSSPTHKGIICQKFEEGVSPPDIGRATGHSLEAVDNYLGTYRRIKLLLRKGFEVETICQVTGKAPRTVAQYLVIVERYHPELLRSIHHDWLVARRKTVKKTASLSPEAMTPMMDQLKKGGTAVSTRREIVDPAARMEVETDDGAAHPRQRRSRRSEKKRSRK